MSSGSYIQRSFAGGEISPAVAARADMVKYSTGLRKCRNFIVEKHGGVRFRPGTSFVSEVKFNFRATRLIEFIFSDDVSYVLEVGHQYIRIFRNAVLLGGWEQSKEVVTPYDENDIFRIQYAQSADVVTLTHPKYPIQQLRRFINEFNEIDFEMIAFETEPGIDPPINIVVDAPPVEIVGGEPEPDKEYAYVVTSISEETGEESLQSLEVSDIGPLNLDDDQNVFITWDIVEGSDEYNIYRKTTTGVFYYIGTRQVPDGFTGSSIQFADNNARIMDDKLTPPRRREPFDNMGDYPSTVSYFQQRQWFASSEKNPQQVHASKTGGFSNFGVSRPMQDDDAITFTIAGRSFNEVRHLVNVGKLLALTSSGEWLIGGDVNSAVTPTQINLQQQGYSGASRIRPIIIENTAIYLQARGNVVRDLRYQFESDGYIGQDLTIFASHLFEGRQIVDWDFQQVPNSVVWAVRDDGVLLGLTYMPEHQLWGWHRHETDGHVETLTVVPEGGQDAVYMVVRREINGIVKRYIERMEQQIRTSIANAFHVDSGLQYLGGDTEQFTMDTSNSTWGSLDDVTLTASGNFFNQGGRDDVGNEVVLKEEKGSEVVDELRVRIIEVVSPTQAIGALQRDAPEFFRDGQVDSFTLAVDSVTGLEHLEGKVVSVVGDGNVVYSDGPNGELAESYRVTNGRINLDRPYSYITVGLPYRGEIETLDLEFPENETLSDKKKLINSVSIIAESSRGIKAGTSNTPDDKLTDFKQREFEPLGSPIELKRGLIEIDIPSDWSKKGSVKVVQDYPLPLTVLAIIPNGRIGGK